MLPGAQTHVPRTHVHPRVKSFMDADTAKPSRKYVKLLCLTVLGMCFLSLFANLVVRFILTDTEFRSVRSGIFSHATWDIAPGFWHFSAGEANGNIVFFTYLSREEIDSFSLQSNISDGAMTLLITQNEVNVTFDLSNGFFELLPSELRYVGLVPGRIQMQLIFTNASGLASDANW